MSPTRGGGNADKAQRVHLVRLCAVAFSDMRDELAGDLACSTCARVGALSTRLQAPVRVPVVAPKSSHDDVQCARHLGETKHHHHPHHQLPRVSRRRPEAVPDLVATKVLSRLDEFEHHLDRIWHGLAELRCVEQGLSCVNVVATTPPTSSTASAPRRQQHRGGVHLTVLP